jgi:beta-lactamase class A
VVNYIRITVQQVELNNDYSEQGAMLRVIGRPFLYLLAVLPALATVPSVAAVAARYDVSYVWSRNLEGVRDYRNRVAGVLGPAVANRLKVVVDGDLYGLVYARHGDSSGATRVAQVHSRLLQSRGLEAASPVRVRDWAAVDDDPSARQVSFASLGTPEASRPKTAKAAKGREVRDLEAAVEDYISRLRREGRIADDERTGWSVYDFTTGEKLVTINEDEQFQTASLVKPFIAAAFFYRVKQGELVYGRDSRRHMELMIQHSNNAATNWVIRQVGGPKAVEQILKQAYPGIFQEIRLVEYIPAGGRTYRNKASLHDYSRFLYAVWKEDIAGAAEIKRLMALPGPDRIFMGVAGVPRGTRVYNKTGSTARVCGDMGILSVKGRDGKRYPYTVIGIIEKEQSAPDYTSWIRSRSEVIRNVSSIIYKGIAGHHDI